MQPQKLERPCLSLEHHYRPQVKVLYSFYYLSKETPQFYWCATSTNQEQKMISNRWGECSSMCEENSPCENNGTCNFNWADQKMNCTCSTGYTGKNCELEKIVKGTSPMFNVASGRTKPIFWLGPIPKPKPKLAYTFGRYRNKYRNNL